MSSLLLALAIHMSSAQARDLQPSTAVVCGAGTQPVLDPFRNVVSCEAVGYGTSSALVSVGYPSASYLPYSGFGFNSLGYRGLGFRGLGLHGSWANHEANEAPCTPVAPATSCVS